MKKFDYFAIVLALLGSSVQAQPSMVGVGQETTAPKKPSLLFRIMNKDLAPGVKSGVAAVMTAPVSQVGKVAGACVISKKICAGMALSAGTLAYLYANPHLVAEYLEKNPSHYDEVQAYFDKRKAKANTPEQLAKYERAEESVGLTEKTLQDQLDLEQTPEFQTEYQKVESVANQIDKEMKPDSQGCSIEIAKNLLLKPAEFSRLINPTLPKINNGLKEAYNVDTYKNLEGEKLLIEKDHIPSYKAIETLFKNKGVSFSGVSLVDRRYSNLENNATSLSLAYATHRNNRTTDKKNNKFYPVDGANSFNLKVATLKDFATILVLEKNNIMKYNKLISSFTLVYTRNKMLCLYDI